MATAQLLPSPPRLDLGSGPRPEPGYVGVDRLDAPHLVRWDFRSGEPWPFATESIEALHSSHLIEHLPPLNDRGRDALIHFFEQAWRICKPGALFRLRWPAPFHPVTGTPVEGTWWDPTHYRVIPYQQIPSYFSRDGRVALEVESYGIECNWVLTRDIGWRALTSDCRVIEFDAELRRES